ncbi:MAG: glycoside hydrolase family 5 protein [Bacteroidales bacterium]|nr:glycoside hydrolase family 5 protein [Bacteroidales bacterium]
MIRLIFASIFLFSFQCYANRQVQKQWTNDKKGVQPFGINLAGAEFGGAKLPGVYNKDYIYPSSKELDYLKSKGIRLVRLPIRWERVQPEPYKELNAFELGKIKEFVVAAEKRQLYVIIDLHNYARRNYLGTYNLIGTGGLTADHLADFWKRLALEMKPFKNIYGHGLMNEPHDMNSETSWFAIAQACIYAIRKVDTEKSILVGGDSWSSAERWIAQSDTLKYLVDPSDNLMFEAHVYFDKDASGAYRFSYEQEECSPYKGVERVQPFVNWLKVNGFKGLIGEYGIPFEDVRWQETLDHFLSYLQNNGINATYWAGGPLWNKYPLSISPVAGKDRPQMKIVEKYLYTKPAKNK